MTSQYWITHHLEIEEKIKGLESNPKNDYIIKRMRALLKSEEAKND